MPASSRLPAPCGGCPCLAQHSPSPAAALLLRWPACRLLPYLPPALEVLLPTQADAADVTDVLLLLNQLMARFKQQLAPLMQVGGRVGEKGG